MEQSKKKNEWKPNTESIMKKVSIKNETSLKVNQSESGERLEEKLEKVLENGEPIKAVAERIYTDRKDGVLPHLNIRTDRWDIAQEMALKANQRDIARRLERNGTKNVEAQSGESTQTTEQEAK